MPVAGAHDPAELKALLEPWITTVSGSNTPAVVTDVEVPQANGFSNETFLLNAQWSENGEPVSAELVLRSQAPEHQMFPIVDLLSQQYRTMGLLFEHTDIPVPRVRWAEADISVLGQPFFLMDRLRGDVPGDNPPYLRDSFVIDMDPATRRTWSENALDALTSVGQVAWRELGFEYLNLTQFGALGPQQRLGYTRHFYEWTLAGEAHPVCDPAFEWLEDNWPDDSEHKELCWGDARPGNMMFNGTDVIGIFDWEMVSIGNAESDLGWWLFLQRFSSEGMGIALPEGILTYDETVARWEENMERPANHVAFYERLAAFQFGLIMVKLSRSLNLGMEVDNPVTPLARALFGL